MIGRLLGTLDRRTAARRLARGVVTREQHGTVDAIRVLPFGQAETLGGGTQLPQPFVLEVRDAVLYGRHAVGFLPDGRVLMETVMGQQHLLEASSLSPFRTPRELVRMLQPPQRYDTLCSLVRVWSDGYFHWTLECLPRLQGYEHYADQTGVRPPLLIDPDPPGWMTETLELLGFTPADWHEWRAPRARVRRLVVPSYRRQRRYTSPAACRWLRDRMRAGLPPAAADEAPSPYLYISRAQARSRRVVNEPAVLDLLRPLGFRVLHPETLSIAEQVRLFSRAQVVVAPHGGGLVNMVYADHLHLIEFFEPSYLNFCYRNLAADLGFGYAQLMGEGQGQDIVVDVDALRPLVQAALAGV